MERKGFRRWGLLLGFAVSAVALYFAFRRADFPAIYSAFRGARYGPIALGFLSIAALTWLRGFRWSILTGGRLRPADGFWLFNIGFLINSILPARLGEFARAYLAGRRERMHFTSALSSIAVERLMDMIAVAAMFAFILLTIELPPWARGAGSLMGVGALAGIIILAIAARSPGLALSLGVRMLAWLPRVDEDSAQKFLRPFIDGLAGVSSLRTFLLGLGLTLLAWFFSGVAGWLMMRGFWPDPPLIDGILAIAASGVGISVPAAPSGVGTFEAAVIGVLAAVGYDADVARGYAIVLHAANIVTTAVIGLIGLMREGLSFRDLLQSTRALKTATSSETEQPGGLLPDD